MTCRVFFIAPAASGHMDVSVSYIDVVDEFIQLAESATSADVLAKGFETATQALGFKYFACCSHADPLRLPRGAVFLYSYPTPWVHIYTEQKLFQIDPVLRYAETTLLPFFWDSERFRARMSRQQREILAQASEFGIAHGYTVPIHPPSSDAPPASCSFVPGDAVLERSSYLAAQSLAYVLYEAASGTGKDEEKVAWIELSKRERQCLELVAQGKSDWVAGKLLGISERTVHNHIERAKRRLRVGTRVQAILHALATRQVSVGDVIKVEPREPSAQRSERRAVAKHIRS